jgi:hypothetical protein
VELAGEYRKQVMEPAEQAQLIAESLVSQWHADNPLLRSTCRSRLAGEEGADRQIAAGLAAQSDRR